MTQILAFTAYGTPITQGSVRAFMQGGRAIINSKTPPLVEWREIVRLACVAAMKEVGLEMQMGPAEVWLSFYLRRPKSAPKTRDIYPLNGKDLDKYERAILDSVTNAGAWKDDSQVVDLHSRKRYAVTRDLAKIYDPDVHREKPGVEVSIQWLDA